MTRNLGSTDRLLRALVAGPLFAVAGLLVGPGGWLAVALYALAAVMFATSAVAYCPIYAALGLSTAHDAAQRDTDVANAAG